MESFASKNEEIKYAASYALGYLGIRNIQKSIPFILHEIDRNSRHQYLLFHSLKELISYFILQSNGFQLFKPFINDVWRKLLEYCKSPEEATRNVVAECLGKLAVLDPLNLRNLKNNLDSSAPCVRSTILTAIKNIITDKSHPIERIMYDCLGKVLNALQDTDLNVRRVALVTINLVAHNKPVLVRDLLVTTRLEKINQPLLNFVYNETKVKIYFTDIK